MTTERMTAEQEFKKLVLKNKMVKLQNDSKVIGQKLRQFAIDYTIIRKELIKLNQVRARV